MKNSQPRLSRRHFLIGLGVGGASATVARMSEEPRQATDGSEKGEAGRGYRLTEHVRNYYRTTKV